MLKSGVGCGLFQTLWAKEHDRWRLCSSGCYHRTFSCKTFGGPAISRTIYFITIWMLFMP